MVKKDGLYNNTGFRDAVYQATSQVPSGKITTYKAIALAIGKPKASRAVGNALNKNPYAPKVPCHRVVKSDGRVGGFASGAEKKIKLLKREGVVVTAGYIENFAEKLFREF